MRSGTRTSYEYDVNNRRTKTTYADGSFDTVGYDALGRSVSKTDQAGKTSQFTYDALGRLTKVKGRAQSGDGLRLQRAGPTAFANRR